MLNFSMKRHAGDQTPAAVTKPVGPNLADTPEGEPQSEHQAKNQAADATCDWWNDELDQAFTAAAQTAELNDQQAATLKALFIETVCQAESQQADDQAAIKQQTLSALERSWGRDANRMFAAANQAASALKLSSEMMEVIVGQEGSEAVLESLAKLGEMMAEDGALPDQDSAAGMARANAKQDLERLNADKEHLAAYLNRGHPGHEAAKRQRKTLIDYTLNQ